MGRVILSNTFSTAMLPTVGTLMWAKGLGTNDVPSKVISAVTHGPTADLLSRFLGMEVQQNNAPIQLDRGDALYVVSPRDPMGRTYRPRYGERPDDEAVRFSVMKVEVV